MSFDDLNLEFEDEEESKKKKIEAVHVDVDLEFQSPDASRSRSHPQLVAKAHVQKAPESSGVVRKIEDARSSQTQVKRPVATSGGQPRTIGTAALKEGTAYDQQSQQVQELRAQMKKIQFEAEVKVHIAEYKTEFLSEMLSDMKLMEHQIGQLVARINAKHPDLKNEILTIKKILADFTTKKRK